MTFEAQVANIIWTAGSLCLLWALGRFILVPAMRDTLRYRLFRLRRDMFLYMAEGGVSADHPAYGHVRSSMNAAIRFSDSISVARTIAGMAVSGKLGRERMREIELSVASLPPGTRERIQDFRQRAALAVGVYAVVRSPLGWIIMLATLPLLVLSVLFSLLKSASDKPWTWIQRSLARKAEQETQILKCMEEEGALAAA
jgi:hypothetical protein